MYNVCLIGYGYWGSKLARNFQNSELFKLTAVVDTNVKNLLKIDNRFNKIKKYKNYKKAIKDLSVDLIVIATPTSTHYKIAKFAIENFKHILVEKPLSLSLSNVKSLNKLAKKNKKLIFVDYPFLFSGSIYFLKKIIDKKKYGKIIEIESLREKAPLRRDANVIWDLCTHDISILTYLIKEKPFSIQTIKRKNFKNFPFDISYVNMKYKSNLNVLIKSSWVSATKIRLIKIKFQNAIIYCNENEPISKIKVYINKKRNNLDKYVLEVPEIGLDEPLSKMVKYIYNSIKTNNNYLFKNNFNEKVTSLLEKINKC